MEETQPPRFNLHLRPEFETVSHANFAPVGFRCASGGDCVSERVPQRGEIFSGSGKPKKLASSHFSSVYFFKYKSLQINNIYFIHFYFGRVYDWCVLILYFTPVICINYVLQPPTFKTVK